jgi:hypothetical protein
MMLLRRDDVLSSPLLLVVHLESGDRTLLLRVGGVDGAVDGAVSVCWCCCWRLLVRDSGADGACEDTSELKEAFRCDASSGTLCRRDDRAAAAMPSWVIVIDADRDGDARDDDGVVAVVASSPPRSSADPARECGSE